MSESENGKPSTITVRKRLSSLLALLVLAVVGGICISLGFWQLDRAAQRDALYEQIEQGRRQPPLVVTASTPRSELVPWRAATLAGSWSNEHTVLLQNRNLHGRPGYWVATPLVLTGDAPPTNRLDAVTAGSAESAALSHAAADEFLSRGPSAQATAVLVLRGWLPRDLQAGESAPEVPLEEGVFRVSGELHAHVPRIFELWDWAGGASSHLPDTLPQAGDGYAQVQNLDLDTYARASGLNLLPVVLAQKSDSVALGTSAIHVEPAARHMALQREWPGPALDSEQNRGYALQWFGFSGIALIAALFVLRSLLRPDRKKHSSKEAP